MSRFPISFFAGEDWDDATMIAQTYAVAVPRQGDQVLIKNTTDDAVDYPVQAVRHEFTGDEQTIKVLLKRRGPSVYETRGMRFL